jgi:hypothetical protein
MREGGFDVWMVKGEMLGCFGGFTFAFVRFDRFDDAQF